MDFDLVSEFNLINRYFKSSVPDGVLGIGDDCALLNVPPGLSIAISKDLLVEGHHFFSSVNPYFLGQKVLAVNLSDLAAMGASPLGCLLGISLPYSNIEEGWLQAFSQGFHELSKMHCCPLLGGDTVRSSQALTISMSILGTVSPLLALRRDRAKEGDDIWVSGSLGAANVAYRLMSGTLSQDKELLSATRKALEQPKPRVLLGQNLLGLAHSAVDISDGLLQDLSHILRASNVAARIRYSDLPVAKPIEKLPSESISQAILAGGDDYELCFTSDPIKRSKIREVACEDVPLTLIGQIENGRHIIVVDSNGKPMTNLPQGYDHFSSYDV